MSSVPFVVHILPYYRLNIQSFRNNIVHKDRGLKLCILSQLLAPLEGSNVYQAQGGNLGVSACAEIGVSGGDLGDARYLKAVLLEKHQGGNEA